LLLLSPPLSPPLPIIPLPCLLCRHLIIVITFLLSFAWIMVIIISALSLSYDTRYDIMMDGEDPPTTNRWW